jgi:hypothetical protein
LRFLFFNRRIFANLGDRIVRGTVVMFDEYFNYPNWHAHEHKPFMEFQDSSGKTFKPIGYSIQQTPLSRSKAQIARSKSFVSRLKPRALVARGLCFAHPGLLHGSAHRKRAAHAQRRRRFL